MKVSNHKERRGFLLFIILTNAQEILVNNEVMNTLMIQSYFSYFSKVKVTEQLQNYLTKLTM